MDDQRIAPGSRDKLQGIVQSLAEQEAERELEALRTGSPFDTGLVEGISNAIEQLDEMLEAETAPGNKLEQVVRNLAQSSNIVREDAYASNDEYVRGVAAGASHVIDVLQDELMTDNQENQE